MVFQVALGLLECCRKELLTLDFEGVLKYFRVQLPKKYRNEDQVKLLTRTAVKMKVSKLNVDLLHRSGTIPENAAEYCFVTQRTKMMFIVFSSEFFLFRTKTI